MGEGAGGIWQLAPVTYDAPGLHKKFLGVAPLLYPK